MSEPSSKPLPKSLHTIKVLNLVTRHNATVHDIDLKTAMEMTLNTLGLKAETDSYGLIATAMKQLEGSKPK